MAIRRQRRSVSSVLCDKGLPTCLIKFNSNLHCCITLISMCIWIAHRLRADPDGCAGGTMTAVTTLLAKAEGVTGIKAQVRNCQVLWLI